VLSVCADNKIELQPLAGFHTQKNKKNNMVETTARTNIMTGRAFEFSLDFKKSVGWNLTTAVVERIWIDEESKMRISSTSEEEFKMTASEDNPSGNSNSSSSSSDGDCLGESVCPFFLQGKCRYKSKCQMSHSIKICPHCNCPAPTGKIAASTHLARCYKSKKVQLENH
jgi:hypothetical protein